MQLTINDESLAVLGRYMREYGEGGGQIIDHVIHGEGAQKISDYAEKLLPVSGRRWKGKARAAKGAKPFQQTDLPQGVIVRSRPKYRYLYFPDDGSNTVNHAGNQQFMRRGAERATPEIVEIGINELIRSFNFNK